MFAKTVIRQGKTILKLNEENKTLYEENKDLRYENEELNLANKNYKKQNFMLANDLLKIQELVNKFDYRKSNSVSIIRKINEVITSDETE